MRESITGTDHLGGCANAAGACVIAASVAKVQDGEPVGVGDWDPALPLALAVLTVPGAPVGELWPAAEAEPWLPPEQPAIPIVKAAEMAKTPLRT